MLKYIGILIVGILTSFYFFPFEFSFLPGINTKMILAAGGLCLMLFNMALSQRAQINRDIFIVSLFALFVSFASILSITYNNTPDLSYVTYITSMWVWLAAAFFVVFTMRFVHRALSVDLVCSYLIAVGVVQCIIAMAIDNVPIIKQIVDVFLHGYGFMGKVNGRLYGIGCALDVAGGRMAVLLVMIAYLLPRSLRHMNFLCYVIPLLLSYCIVAVIGNMIGRTTTVGLIFSLLYLSFSLISRRDMFYGRKKEFVKCLVFVVVLVVPLLICLYMMDDYWKEYLRFGFEGFFSLIEKGEWEVHSNQMLAEGFIFPDNIRGWMIGDGYMGNPDADPYYIGEASYGYYKNTDSGYSRFLFYFGIVGLFAFSVFLIKLCQIIVEKLPQHKLLFLMILLLNFLIWIKVSTDIFLAMAPFLLISAEENEEG